MKLVSTSNFKAHDHLPRQSTTTLTTHFSLLLLQSFAHSTSDPQNSLPRLPPFPRRSAASKMASYFSSLLTTTTSRVATLRQNLLPSENDGDTLDDTHLCRVLRAYYTEKGRALPGWLPPDPKAPPPPVVVQPVFTSNVGAGYGGGINQAPAGRGALSSLWDTQGRGRPSNPMSSTRSGSDSRQASKNPFAPKPQTATPEVQARPLPSQRVGSYQTAGAYSTPPGSSGGHKAAASKLKFKYGRVGQTPSPANDAAPSGPQVENGNSYLSSAGGGSGNYEDRFMPPENEYGGQRSGGANERPFVAATAPWASNASEFEGGGYAGGYDRGGGGQGGRQGLPGGPAAGRRGPGLPGGPRGYRP